MYESEVELQAELEELISILAESHLEHEAEAELTRAQKRRGQGVAGDQIRGGSTDENQLTDAVFYDLHPAWKDKKLPAHADPKLISDWNQIRDLLVRPMLKDVACSRWESDPESFSKVAAEHHLKTAVQVTKIVRMAGPPNWSCSVSAVVEDRSVVLTIQLSPAEKLVRVRPASNPPGQVACYRYRCLASGNLIVEDSVCPVPAAQPELETELENLMAFLGESDLKSEAEMFTPP